MNKYWKQRCLAAEDFIEKSPCDPDITDAQTEAYEKWKLIRDNIPLGSDDSGNFSVSRDQIYLWLADFALQYHQSPKKDIANDAEEFLSKKLKE
jgi:hypothetical protein